MKKAWINVNITNSLGIINLPWIERECVYFQKSAHAVQNCNKAFAIVMHEDGQEHNSTWHSKCCVECMGVQ